jgi:hypothetical protein
VTILKVHSSLLGQGGRIIADRARGASACASVGCERLLQSGSAVRISKILRLCVPDFDLAIVGGVSTAPASRATPGRGLRVLLVEQKDPASGHLVGLDQAHPRRLGISSTVDFAWGARR